MTGHIFLLNSQLYFTNEEIPKKSIHNSGSSPSGLDYEIIDELNDRYESALASIRERATLVGNQEMAKQYWWVQGTPNEGISHLDWLKTREEGEFYPIDCEVRYEERPTGIISGGLIPQGQIGGKGLTHHTKTVVFLSPLSSVSEEDQDDLWEDVADLMAEGISVINSKDVNGEYLRLPASLVNALKSRFKITRIK